MHRARRAEWHEEYTLPSLWRFYEPSKVSHGSYWHSWGTEQEVVWKENYRLWMTFINEYKNRGGRVTAGSDSGFIYQLYGFAYIRELELLREAGFHPLEVIRSATLNGAEALGAASELGTVEPGKLADLVILDKNPLENIRNTNTITHVVKDGRVYDGNTLDELLPTPRKLDPSQWTKEVPKVTTTVKE